MIKITDYVATVEAALVDIKGDLVIISSRAVDLKSQVAALQAQITNGTGNLSPEDDAALQQVVTDASTLADAADTAAGKVIPPPPNNSNFQPASPTPDDVYTDGPIYDFDNVGLLRGKILNIISTGRAPTQVRYILPLGSSDRWEAQPDVSVGDVIGKVWKEKQNSDATLILWFCASGLVATGPVSASTGGTIDTPPPPSGPVGAPNLAATVLTDAMVPPTSDPDLIQIPIGNLTIWHQGRLLPAPPADGDMDLTKNLGAYSVTARDGSIVNVPGHWHNARWTDRSLAPLTINTTPAALVAAHRMFPYGDIGCGLAASATNAPYTIMGTSDASTYEPTTGERPAIGLITDNSAFWMMGGDGQGMLDWARAGESCPIHFRDQTTGQPINKIVYQAANAYDSAGYQASPWVAKGTPIPQVPGNLPNLYSAYGGGWTPDQAHHAEYSYVAYMATGDLALLSSLQYHANFMLVCNAAASGTSLGAVLMGQPRGVSWGLRDLFMAHTATADAEAKGVQTGAGTPFLTASYFKKLLDQSLAFYDQYRTARDNQVFKMFAGNSGQLSPWSQDYALSALAFGVLTGHSDWADQYLFYLGNVIDRLSGASGYPPGWGGAYYLRTLVDGKALSWKESFDDIQNSTQGDIPSTAQLAALAADPFNGGVPMTGYEYLMTTRAVMAMAVYISDQGILDVRKTYPNLDFCYGVAHRMIVGPTGNGRVNPRQSVLTKAAA